MNLRHPFLALISMLVLARCDCDGGNGIYRATVELELNAVLDSPCGGPSTTHRLPDEPIGPIGLRPSQPQTFSLRSLGAVGVTISAVELSAPSDSISIAVVRGDAPVALPLTIQSEGADAEPHLIRVTYEEVDDRVQELELIVRSDDPERDEVRIPMIAGPGTLEVSRTAIDFGSVAIGQQKVEQLTLKSTGRGAVALQSIRLLSASAEFCSPEANEIPTGATCQRAPLCPVLSAGQEIVINVAYAPEDGNADTGTLSIVPEGRTAAIDVPLNGRGAGAALCACVVEGGSCTPVTSIDFGTVASGTTETRMIRLESCGTDPVELASVDLERDPASQYATPAEFEVDMPFPPGALSPGQYTEGVLSYRPTTDASHSGGLRVVQSSPARTFWVPIGGNTVACDLVVLPSAVDFGVVPGGTTSTRNVLVSNVGARSCDVIAITDPDNGFTIVQKPALPLTIASGDSVSLAIDFASPADAMAMLHQSRFEITGQARDRHGGGAGVAGRDRRRCSRLRARSTSRGQHALRRRPPLLRHPARGTDAHAFGAAHQPRRGGLHHRERRSHLRLRHRDGRLLAGAAGATRDHRARRNDDDRRPLHV